MPKEITTTMWLAKKRPYHYGVPVDYVTPVEVVRQTENSVWVLENGCVSRRLKVTDECVYFDTELAALRHLEKIFTFEVNATRAELASQETKLSTIVQRLKEIALEHIDKTFTF